MKKLALALSILLLLPLLSACADFIEADTTDRVIESQVQAPQTVVTPESFSLTFNANDSLNPYEAQDKINLYLSDLLFDSLVTVDNTMTAQYAIAEKIELSGTTCVVHVRRDISFSDGSKLSGADVRFSMQRAMAKSAEFKAKLSNVASVSLDDNYTLRITLKTPDLLFANNLDFPVIKQGTEPAISKVNGKIKNIEPPVGSGRYVYAVEDAIPKLKENTKHREKVKAGITEIRLYDMPDIDAMRHSVEIGTVSYIYNDLSDGKLDKINVDLGKVQTTNLVYLGLNSASSVLQEPKLREAVLLLINKQTVAEQSYAGYAQAADTPFHPDFAPLKGLSAAKKGVDRDAAVALLAEAGYDRTDTDGVRTKEGSRLTLKLAVNKENDFRSQAATAISENLKAAGISVEIVSVDYKTYLSNINGLQCDMYIGEINVGNNFDLSPILKAGGSAAAGIATAVPETGKAYDAYRAGSGTLQAFLNQFFTDIPFVPLCYRNGMAAYVRGFEVAPTATVSDIFSNIEQMKIN